MSTKKKIIISLFVTLIVVAISVFSFGYWFMGLIKADLHSSKDIEKTLPSELVYMTKDSVPFRGKILAVVTSQTTMGKSGKPTGYELSELARAYYVFTANGFEVEVASPQGGEAPMLIDDDDMGQYDYAFLNDSVAKSKVKKTLKINELNPDAYEAVYFVGGKGAMFDFPNDSSLQQMVVQYYESGKVIGAVCHGPAALVNVKLTNGNSLLEGKKTTSFTNKEEFFLIPDASEIFPFMLQEKLLEKGAQFQEEAMYLENVVIDGNLVTGQNPWSTWLLAESMIQQLDYKPKSRQKTSEENAIQALKIYHSLGYDGALAYLKELNEDSKLIQRELIAVHSIIAIMDFELGKAFDLIALLAQLNQLGK